jgi:hypothetical protein
MLLLGFALAARRSDQLALDVEDVEFTAKGALVTIKRSKTDQEAGAGRWRCRRGAPALPDCRL